MRRKNTEYHAEHESLRGSLPKRQRCIWTGRGNQEKWNLCSRSLSDLLSWTEGQRANDRWQKGPRGLCLPLQQTSQDITVHRPLISRTSGNTSFSCFSNWAHCLPKQNPGCVSKEHQERDLGKADGRVGHAREPREEGPSAKEDWSFVT